MSQSTEQSIFEILAHLGELQNDNSDDGSDNHSREDYAAAPKIYEAKVSWNLPFTVLKETLTVVAAAADSPSEKVGDGAPLFLLKATIGTSVPCELTVSVGKRHKVQREYFRSGPHNEIRVLTTKKDIHKGEINVVIKITRAGDPSTDAVATATTTTSCSSANSVGVELEEKGKPQNAKDNREEYIIKEITRLSIEAETGTVKVCGQEAVGSDGIKFVLEDFYDGEHCLICFDDNIDTACLPCRHLCLCSSCADMLRVNTGVCPVCRCGIASLIKIKPDKEEKSDSNSEEEEDDDNDE